jgi:3-hydroxypropanoate dehydrogenase
LTVQSNVTDIELSPADLAELETELASDLASDLAIDSYTQDLLFRQARTPRAFDDSPVSDATMRAVYNLIKWGPTGRNGQPLRVVLVRSAEARERLVRHLSPGNRDRTTAAPLVALLAVDLDFHDELSTVAPAMTGAREAYADEARRIRAATSSALLQIGYFIVGVRAAGLAAGPMEGFDAAGVDQEFFPDGRHRTMLVMNLGYPAPNAYKPRQPRLDYDEVVTTV